MKQVRTRFAPSPTGYMHIGNLRTAIYEYLVARVEKGSFLLRIEDTDQERFVEGATEVIYNTLKTVGLEYDEGPDIGGPYGPYVQSERRELYQDYARRLVDAGGAYYCFCDKERLDALRQDCEARGTVFRYDGHCRHLSKEEIERRLAANEPYVIRQRVPETGTTSFHDLVYGTITVENAQMDDGVMLKSDGLPTYNFANVVDDHLMEISHVVRGAEYLSSTPKYNLIYQAYGWEVPAYIHLPPIMKSAEKKLSKRAGDASFEDLLKRGFLKDAIVNYVVLLGWSPGTEEEFFSLEDLKSRFSIEGLSKSPAIFDMNKLRWMNAEYIRRLSPEDFHAEALPYYGELAGKGLDLAKISQLIQQRTEVLEDIPDKVHFFAAMPEYDAELYVHKKMKTDVANSLVNLRAAREALAGLTDWNLDSIQGALSELVAALGVKNSQVLWPVRTALSGQASSPGGAYELAEILGREESLRRMDIGIAKLG